jgi:5-methylcytosine-specific restriction endonuclease McrA
MTTNSISLGHLSDGDLLAAVHRLAVSERRATARLIASLAELDARRLYLAEGYSSLFTYCTRVLHLSEHAAYGRIEAARAVRTYPVLLDLLETGDITLTTISLLAPHLTPDNHRRVLEAARHRSKREVEHLVATLRPQPLVPSAIRKLPDAIANRTCPASLPPLATSPLAEPATSSVTADQRATTTEAKPAIVTPLQPHRYKVQFTVDRDTLEKLRRVQELMRHTCPSGDVAIVFERALTVLLAHLERTKLAQVSRPRQSYRAASVRRTVWTREKGQCAFVGTRGRCTERGLLEFHHVVPFAEGGTAVAENIQLRCRAHNQHESDQWFGAGGSVAVRERPDLSGWLATRSGPS